MILRGKIDLDNYFCVKISSCTTEMSNISSMKCALALFMEPLSPGARREIYCVQYPLLDEGQLRGVS